MEFLISLGGIDVQAKVGFVPSKVTGPLTRCSERELHSVSSSFQLSICKDFMTPRDEKFLSFLNQFGESLHLSVRIKRREQESPDP